MNLIKNELEQIGFHGKSSGVYVALLELGTASATSLSKKTGIKRTTIYNILNELIREGLVQQGKNKKRTFFFVNDVRKVKTLAEEKLARIESLLPELSAIHNLSSTRPKITVYEGIQGMKDLYQDWLNSMRSGETVLSILGLEDFFKNAPKGFTEYIIRERVKKKVRTRIIALDSKLSRDFRKNALQELRDIRVVPSSLLPGFLFQAGALVYAKKVAFISFSQNEDFVGMIIESKEINRMLWCMFEMIWRFADTQLDRNE